MVMECLFVVDFAMMDLFCCGAAVRIGATFSSDVYIVYTLKLIASIFLKGVQDE